MQHYSVLQNLIEQYSICWFTENALNDTLRTRKYKLHKSEVQGDVLLPDATLDTSCSEAR